MNRVVQGTIFVLTLTLSAVIGAALGLLHVPFRAEISTVSHFVDATTPAIQFWKAVHLLSTNCPCSRKVSAHLLQRGPLPGLQEYVVLAGSDAALAQHLTQAGFHVQTRSVDEIANKFHVPGAPWFILVSPAQKIFYAGGYSVHQGAGKEYEDQQIWQSAISGLPSKTLPVYGCALGRRLQRKIDPLQLKY